LSRKAYQSLIYQVSAIIDSELGVIDRSGLIIACSDERKIGQRIVLAKEIIECDDVFVKSEGRIFQKLESKDNVDLMTFISDENEERINQLKLFSININTVKIFSDEKYDKGNLMKSIIFESILPGDAALRARDMNISLSALRTVFLIRTEKGRELHSYEIIQNLFPNRAKDYVIIVDNENALLIKELKPNQDSNEINKIAEIIIDTLNTESMIKAVVGIGTIVDSLTDLGRSYKEAQIALKIGAVFESEKTIINCNNLGIGRLIYQLPHNICKMFLKEIFGRDVFEALEEEYLLTIQKLFENNLNVSEASRKMYIHRNTLVYRLEKIKKITGLDLTKFDDAIVFKVAILVRRYLDKSEKRF